MMGRMMLAKLRAGWRPVGLAPWEPARRAQRQPVDFFVGRQPSRRRVEYRMLAFRLSERAW